jgi:hypothetical protein
MGQPAAAAGPPRLPPQGGIRAVSLATPIDTGATQRPPVGGEDRSGAPREDRRRGARSSGSSMRTSAPFSPRSSPRPERPSSGSRRRPRSYAIDSPPMPRSEQRVSAITGHVQALRGDVQGADFAGLRTALGGSSNPRSRSRYRGRSTRRRIRRSGARREPGEGTTRLVVAGDRGGDHRLPDRRRSPRSTDLCFGPISVGRGPGEKGGLR